MNQQNVFKQHKMNTSLLTFLCLAGFIISGIFTANSLSSMAQSKESKILLVIMAIIFEFAKGYSFFEFMSGRHRGTIQKMLFVVWIAVVCFSLFASVAFSLNESNKSANKLKTKTVINQDDQKSKDVAMTAQDTLIKSLTSEIEALKNEKSTLPEDYITKRKEMQDSIDTKTNQLTEATKGLVQSADKKVNVTELQQTEGCAAILAIIVKFLNKSGVYLNNKWTEQEATLTFFFLLAATLEILICLFYYLKKYNQAIDNGTIPLPRENVRVIVNEDQKEKTLPVSNDTKMLPSNDESNVSKEIEKEKIPDKVKKFTLSKKKLYSKQSINLEKPERVVNAIGFSFEPPQANVNIDKDEKKHPFYYDRIENKKVGSIKNTEPTTPSNHYDRIKNKNNKTTNVGKQKIGFNIDNCVDTIYPWEVEYLKLLCNTDYHTDKFGATGFKKIHKMLKEKGFKVTQTNCQQFRGTLQRLEIIKTEGQKNILLVKNPVVAIKIASQSLKKRR